MTLLLACQSLSKSFGPRPLFREVALSVSAGERLGLIGPNGSGKSTLLKILAGREQPDTGTLTLRKGLTVGYVAQADVFPAGATPLSVVADATKPVVATTDRSSERRSLDFEHEYDRDGDHGHVYAHHDHDAHERETRAELLLAKLGFPRFDQSVDDLSGGWRKRLAIARELARDPDLLLLDEPTNHLDLEGILWLEELLDDAPFGVVVVTHDRYFLEEVASRIVELSPAYPKGTFDVEGSYSEFLERRAEFMEAQATQEQALAGKVRADIAWLRRGAKARRTKAKGRIQDASQRMDELAELKRRNAPNRAAAIDFGATGRQTRNLLVAKSISKSLAGRSLFSNLDLTLSPGMRLGLVGPNGSGKTTLIKVLTGELPPDSGTVKPADNLRTATFTQRRAELDRRQELKEALCPIGDTIFYRDRAIHIITWAQKFLFRADQLNVPVGDLSGGEQARIMIAALMRLPADLLILDEPTNDLDIPSLEVLEQSLEDFPGAVLLVTHDRFMLDRLSTHVLGLDGRGGAKMYSTYRQWAAAQARGADGAGQASGAAATKPAPARDSSSPTPAAPGSPGSPASSRNAKPGRLSYNEQREWDQMESKIQAAEATVAALEKQTNDPTLLADRHALAAHCDQLHAAQAAVTALYERWSKLEAKQKA